VTGVLGGTFLVGAAVVALMVADVPAGAVVTGAAFGALGLLGAFVRVRDYLRYRRRFRSRPLTGWRLTAAALASAALGTGSAAAGFRGSASGSAVLGVLAASVAMRCAVAGWLERSCPQPGLWTEQDEVILSGDVSLPAWESAGQADRGEAR